MAKLTDVLTDIATGAIDQYTKTRNAVVEDFIIQRTKSETINLGITELQDAEQIKARIQGRIQESLAEVLGNDPFLRGKANAFVQTAVNTAVQNRLDFFAQNPERTVGILLRNTNNDLATLVMNGQLAYETAVSTAIDSLNDPKIKKYLNSDQLLNTKERMIEELATIAMQTAIDPQTRAVILDQTKTYLPPKKLLKLAELYNKLNQPKESYLSQQEFQTAYRKVIANKPLNKKEEQSVLASISQDIIEAVRSQPPDQLDEGVEIKLNKLRKLLGAENASRDEVQKLAIDAVNNEDTSPSMSQEISQILLEMGTLQARSDWLSSRMAIDSAQTAVEQGFTPQVDINFLDASSVSRGLDQAYANFQYTKQYRGGSTFLDRENLSILNTTYTDGNVSTRFGLVEQLSKLPQDARLALTSQLADSNPSFAATLELKAINPRLEPAQMLAYTEVKKGVAPVITKVPQKHIDMIREAYANTPEIGTVMASTYINGPEEVKTAILDSFKGNSSLFSGSPIYFSDGRKLNMRAAISVLNLDELRSAALNAGEFYIDGEELSEEAIQYLIPENIGGGGYYLYLSISGKTGRYLTDKLGNKVIISHESLSSAAQPAAKRIKVLF